MSLCSTALDSNVAQWKFTDQVYTDDAAPFTSDAASNHVLHAVHLLIIIK